MKKYWIIWLRTSLASVQGMLTHRGGAVLFLTGKWLRFGLFIWFLQLLHQRLAKLDSYSFEQLLTFFLVFNLVDLVPQIFFRGIYWFRNQVVSGEFDFVLLAPMNGLWRIMTQSTDILDVPLLILVGVMLARQPINWWGGAGVMGLVLLVSGLVVVTAIHIGVAALGVVTTEVDQTIMMYRDIAQMARFPVDIYTDWLRNGLTFVIPVAVAFTWPAKALLGLLSWPVAGAGVAVAVIAMGAALKLWHYALKQYASASS